MTYLRRHNLLLALAAIALLAFAPGAHAVEAEAGSDPVEELEAVDDFELLADDVDRFEDRRDDHEVQYGTEIVEQFGGGLEITNSAPQQASGNGYVATPRPERIEVPGAFGGWTEYDLGSAYGVIRFRLVDRVAGQVGDASEGAVVVEDAWKGTGDVVTVADGTSVEDYVIVDAEDRGGATVLEYEFDLPAGLQLTARSAKEVVVETTTGLVVFSISRTTLQDESGNTFDASLRLDGSHVVVDFTAAAAQAVGDVLVDPLFGQPGGGTWTYKVCGTGNAGVCYVPGATFPAGWTREEPGGPPIRYRVNRNAGIPGISVAANAAASSTSLLGTARWVPPTGNTIDFVNTSLTTSIASANYSCRIDSGPPSGVASIAGAWVSASNAQFGGTMDTTRAGFAGIMMKANVNNYTPSQDTNRCWMAGGSDHFTMAVADELAPHVPSPSATNIAINGGVPVPYYNNHSVWNKPSDQVYFPIDATERGVDSGGGTVMPGGSGINALGIVMNPSDDPNRGIGSVQHVVATGYNICPDPGAYDQRPCSLQVDGGYIGPYTLGSIPGMVTGYNSVRNSASDFAGRLGTSLTSTFLYDPVGPVLTAAYAFPAYSNAARVHTIPIPITDNASGVSTWKVVDAWAGGAVEICSGSYAPTASVMPTCTWQTNYGPDGTHTLYAYATDAAGIQSGILLGSTYVDLTAPVFAAGTAGINFTTPDPVTGRNIQLSWSASDGQSGLERYDVCWVTTAVGCDPVNAASSYVPRGWSTSLSLTSPPGYYYAVARATDQAGNVASSVLRSTYLAPMAPNAPGMPTISPIAGETALVSWAPSAPTDLKQVAVAGYEVCIKSAASGCTTDAEYTSWSPVSSMTSELPQGAYFARVRAVDEMGSKSTPSGWSTGLTIDGTPPTVAITSANASVRDTSNVAVSATAGDPSGIADVTFQRRRSDQEWADASTDAVTPFEASLTAAQLVGDGRHLVRAVARDAKGNTSSSEFREVCVDRAALGQPAAVRHRLVGTPATTAEVWWDAPSTVTGVAGYLVLRRDSSTGPWTVISRGPKSVRSISDQVPTETTEYKVESIGQLCTTTPSGVGTTSVADEGGSQAQAPINAARIGVEDHWNFASENLGGGASASVNVAGGNVVIGKAFPSAKGRVFDTTPTLTWNSQDSTRHDSSVAGSGTSVGWTFGLGGLAAGDEITSFTGVSLEPLVRTPSTIALRDDDGTRHAFTAGATAGVYDAPAGTWLYVRDISVTGEAPPAWAPNAVIAATRPDRVTYWYADHDSMDLPAKDGRLLGLSDRTGQQLAAGAQVRLAYECVAIVEGSSDTESVATGGCAGETAPEGRVLRHRLASLTDAGDRTMTFGYYDEDAASSSRNRDGLLRSVTDFAGVEHRVEYDRLGASFAQQPRLATIREAAGTGVERTTQFQHGLADEAASRWVDESELVTSVVDPRGAASRLRYDVVDDEYLPRLVSFVDRYDDSHSHEATTFTYGVSDGVLDGSVIVRDEARRGSTYRFDGFGRIIQSTTATGQRQQTEYNSMHRVLASKVMRGTDEQLVLAGTSAVALGRTTIDAGEEIEVRSTAFGQGTRYELGTDYTVATAPLRITRTAASAIPSGSTVHVSYVYARSTSTWHAGTGYLLSSRSPAPLRVNASGVQIAPTAGELASPAERTYTNFAFGDHVADVATITTPRGTATPAAGDFVTTYTYDANLRPASIISPINKATGAPADLATRTFAYYPNGDLKSETDTQGRVTGFSAYDDSGEARYGHKATAPGVAFSPLSTPRTTITIHDAMGRTTCVDQLETGDPGVSPCNTVDCGISAQNKTYDETSYDELGRAKTATAPWNGIQRRATVTTYDANGNVSASLAEIGYTVGQTSPTNPDPGLAGVVTTTSFDELDRAYVANLPANDSAGSARQSKTYFDAADQVTREVQPQGVATENKDDYTTWYSYDADGRVLGTRNGNGELSCAWYGAVTGRKYATSLPMAVAAGTTTCPTAVPSSYVETTAYDRAGNAYAVTGITNRTTETYFDDEGNAIRAEDAAGNATLVNADPNGETIEMQAPAVTACTSATACGVANRATVTPTYTAKLDGEGNVIAEADERAGVEGAASTYTTSTTYNAAGDATTVTLPGAATPKQNTQYDAQGNVVATTIQTSASSAAAADANEKATWTTTPDGAVIAKTDAATGSSFTATYDVGGRLKTRTEHGVTTTFAYFPDGSLKQESARKLSPAWEPNKVYAAGQCIIGVSANLTFIVIEGGTSGTVQPGWNTGGVTTADGVSYKVDDCIEDTTYTYDRNGQELSVTQRSDGRASQKRVVRRDNAGRVIQDLGYNDPDNPADDAKNTVTRTYDRNGNVTQEINGGRRNVKTYGASGATTGVLTGELISYVGGTTEMSATFEYDTPGRLSAIIRGGTTTNLRTDLRYDAAGRLARIASCRPAAGTNCVDAIDGAQALDTVPQDFRYVFDAAGNIREKSQLLWQANDASVRTWEPSQTYAAGQIVNPQSPNKHQYIALNAGITAASAPAWPTAAGGVVSSGSVMFREATATTTYAYDAQNRLVLEDRPDDPTTLQDYTRRYVYDVNGRLDKIENADCTSGDAVAENYSYDEAGQTTQMTAHDVWEYTVAAGACAKLLSTETDIEFGEAGSGQEGAMVGIDTVDHLDPAESEETDLEFAEDNALLSVQADDGVTVISRDAEGRPMESTDGNEIVKYGYVDEAREPVMIAEGGDEEARGQLTAPNGWLIAENRDPADLSRYYLNDHLGTPVAEFKRAGNEVGSKDLDPFGQEAPLQSSGTMTTTIGFAGERKDPETGFTDHDSRSYNPELRTWVSGDQYSDPDQDLELAQDPLNSQRMLYAGGDPVNNLDPDGHMSTSASGAVNRIQVNGGRMYDLKRAPSSRVIGTRSSSGGGWVYSAAEIKRQQAIRKRENEKATKARWNARPEVKAKKQRLAKRKALQASIKKSCRAAGGTVNASWKCVGERSGSAHSLNSIKKMGLDPANLLGSYLGGVLTMGSRTTQGQAERLGPLGVGITAASTALACRNGATRDCAGAVGSAAGGTIGAGLGTRGGPIGVGFGAGVGSYVGVGAGEASYDIVVSVPSAVDAVKNHVVSGGNAPLICLPPAHC